MAASTRSQTKEGRWLSLARARELLQVHESTLRGWADEGKVRVFRTPGGHRRFLREDVEALTNAPAVRSAPSVGWEEGALRRIRRGLHQERLPHSPEWMEHLDPEGRLRLRLFGRRLLDICVTFLTQRRRRPALLEEVQLLGREYGLDLARLGMPLGEVVEAFVFFRNSLFEAVRASAVTGPLQGTDMAHLWAQVEQVTDRLLVSMIQAHERSGHATASVS